MSAVPSEAISMRKDMQAHPIVNHRVLAIDQGRYRRQIEHFEYYWGMQKGELDLSSPLNHIQLREDMVAGLEDLEWILLPTKETLDAIYEMAEFNKTASLESRKHFLKELPEKEYEYDVVPLYLLKHRHPLYVQRGTAVRAFRAPYRTMPRIRSRAHPFFVVFYADDQLDMSAALVMPEKKARSLMSPVSRIISCWTAQPPPEFLIGPDVWWPHRHPLSDDGQDEPKCHAPSESRWTHNMITRLAIRTPCPRAKSVITTPKPYARFDPRPARVRGSVLPRPGRQSGNSATCGLCYKPSAIRKWLSEITPTRCSSPSPVEDGTCRDVELSCYRLEAVREADDALNPYTNEMYSTGLLIGRGNDWSRFSSNNWAMYVRGTCLLNSSEPPC